MKDGVLRAQRPRLSYLKFVMDRILKRPLTCRSEALNFMSSAPVEMKGRTAGVQALVGFCRGIVIQDLLLGL